MGLVAFVTVNPAAGDRNEYGLVNREAGGFERQFLGDRDQPAYGWASVLSSLGTVKASSLCSRRAWVCVLNVGRDHGAASTPGRLRCVRTGTRSRLALATCLPAYV